MSGKYRNLFDWDGMMEDPTRRGLLGMGMSLLGDSGYSRVPVTLGQALGRGLLQGLDQSGQARAARLEAEARQAEQAEAAAKRAQEAFERDLKMEKLGFDREKFKHDQAESAALSGLRQRLLKRLGPGSSPPVSPVPPTPPGPAMAGAPMGSTGSRDEPVGQGGDAASPAFPLTMKQAMGLRVAGLPDFTDDVAAHRRSQFDEKKLAYQQTKDARDFDYRIKEKRIDQLRTDRAELADAPMRYQRLVDAEALLDQGIYSGSWPERFAHSLNKFIPMDREGLARTEAFVALMGREALEIVKQLGSGTAISDADRIYAQEIAGGSLETSERGLRKIIAIAKREMTRDTQRWNRQLPNRLKGLEDYFPEDLGVRLPGGADPGQTPQGKAPSEMTDEELRRDLGL